MELAGKVVLLPGGKKGIALALAEELLCNGAKVCICDKYVERECYGAKNLLNLYSPNILSLKECDFTEKQEMEESIQHTINVFGKIDMIVNSFGMILEGKSWERSVDVNLKAVINSCYLGLKYMSKLNGGKGGRILNVSSTLALKPCISLPVYTATKAAINQFSRSLGAEFCYEQTGVQITAVNVAPTESDSVMSCEGLLSSEIQNIKLQYKIELLSQPTLSLDTVSYFLIKVLMMETTGTIWVVDGTRNLRKLDDVQ